MSRLNLRKKPRVCYYEPEEPPFDEYVFCTECRDYVYEYCSIHGPLLIIPDEKIYDKNHKPSHVIDARDDNASNWMRYVNCSRHISEQNLVAYQYQGQLYYRTIKVIPRFEELLVFYGCEFAATLGVELRLYSVPCECYACRKPVPRKAQFKRSQRPAQIEDKPREEKILKENPVEDIQEPSIPITKDLQTRNSSTVSATSIAKEQLKVVEPKKKKNNKNSSIEKSVSLIKSTNTTKKTVKKFNVPVIKSTNTSAALVAEKKIIDKNIIFTDVPPSDSKTTTVVYKCDKCNENFDIKSDLEKHIATHKPDYSTVDHDFTNHVREDTCTNPNASNVSNSASSLSFISKSSLNNLKKKHKKDRSKSNFIKHVGIRSGEKPYKCDTCSYSTALKCNFTTHIRIHSGEKPYKCDICSYATAQKSYLTKHIRIHSGEKSYKCDICSYAAAQKIQLILHNSIHSGEKPFKCDTCSYSTALKCNLTRHIRIHSGEKPYKCDICSFAAAQKSYLTKHIRIHSGEKPYKCDICSFAAAQKSYLTKHIRIHSGEKPYKCDICSFAATHKIQLISHNSIHTGEKPYKCDTCSYATARKSDLTIHIRIHSGEKPYKCDICDYRCAHTNSLKRHLLGVHGGVKPLKRFKK